MEYPNKKIVEFLKKNLYDPKETKRYDEAYTLIATALEEQEAENTHSIRNKLGKITYLLSVISNDKLSEYKDGAIKLAKKCVNDLSKREVYKNL
jgi:hypothetical protein